MERELDPCALVLTSVEQVALSTASTQMVLEELQILFNEFEDIFQSVSGLPPARLQNHGTPLKDKGVVVKIRPYMYPMIQKLELEKLVGEMFKARIIRDSSSPFTSPVVMVKKKDRTWRLCVDYKHLNQKTIKDRFPIPIIEELLDERGQAQIFSKLDLKSGYHHIRMHEADIPKTAFKMHEGYYEFLVMPFGLTNSPFTFQGLMNTIFRPLLRKTVLVFFDDILAYSSTWIKHLNHLREVFELLRQH